MTEVVNPLLGKIEKAIERFGLYAISEVGVDALFVVFPALAVWPLGPFIRKAVDFGCDKLFEVIRLTIDLKVIRFVNPTYQAAFDRNAVKLHILLKEGHGPGSEEFEKGFKDASNAFAGFVRFRGA